MNIDAEERYGLKLKAAYLYYEENMTQIEISKMLNISRPTLSKLLKECREEGIVEIRINDTQKKSHLINLEIELKKRYKLKDVRVVECDNENNGELTRKLGKAAASYFERIISSNMNIGISWGNTLKAVIDSLREDKSIKDLEIVTLIGGSGGLDSQIHANILCEKFLNKYNGKGYFLYAPTIVDSKEMLKVFMSNRETNNILEKTKSLDIALVGIGGPIEHSTVLQTGYFDEELIAELKRQRAVGDICSRFFDESGSLCNLDINERVVGVSLKDLKKIKNVIGVAGGREKLKSIHGALNGGIINILITDECVARDILEM